jgi:hypothetical protein
VSLWATVGSVLTRLCVCEREALRLCGYVYEFVVGEVCSCRKRCSCDVNCHCLRQADMPRMSSV